MKLEKAATKNEPYGYNSELSSSDELELSIIQWQSPRYNVWLKVVAVIVVGVFLCQQVVWAGDIKDILPANKEQVETPKQTLEETQDAQQREQELMEEMEPIEPKPLSQEPAAEETEKIITEEKPAIDEQAVTGQEVTPQEVVPAEEKTAVEETPEAVTTEEVAPVTEKEVPQVISEELEKTTLPAEEEISAEPKPAIGTQIVDAVTAFLEKVIRAESALYQRLREILEKYNPQLLTQEGFDSLRAYLLSQGENIVNCASFALAKLFDLADNFRIAATTILIDIFYGVLLPTAKGILQTSLFALREAARTIKDVSLYAIDVSVEQLKAITTPVIAYIKDGHYIVINTVKNNVVTYIDDSKKVFTAKLADFVQYWKGVILSTVKPEGAQELTEAEQKAILGAGLTQPEDYGFTVGSTADGNVLLDNAAVYSGDEYSLVLKGNDNAYSSTYAEKTITLTEATRVSFAWMVSSESNYDCLKFYVDGVMKDEISGETDWAVMAYDLGAGEHILRWEYV
ncbi:MAG: cysteine peptidase family C39 domain-containing protein, partial [Candidatus Omnitrophica bacterium]|nr:cysteine peptidase family C39 domain-containing protein [Candidatus Omnitrophota bacterium]